MRPQPRIELLRPKLLVGMRREMSQVDDATSGLWRAFRPRVREVVSRATDETISMRVYPGSAQDVFDPEASFVRWAAVEVTDHERIPQGMEPYRLGGGIYAVFDHRGPASDTSIFRYIFAEWLPGSGRALAHREHFEILPAGYDPYDAETTEQIWIPVTE